MKLLQITADDFGLTEGTCRGIIRAMECGIVSATSALMCRVGGVRLLDYVSDVPGPVGIHLQLTDGEPCRPENAVPSLTRNGGRFPRFRSDVGPLDKGEVRDEWRAQLDRFLRLGLTPSHLDSHHHVHLREDVFDVFCQLAEELNVPGRTRDPDTTAALRMRGVRSADISISGWSGNPDDPLVFVREIEKACARYPEATVFEVICHPADLDDDLLRASTYAQGREAELTSLCGEELRHAISCLDVRLIGPADIPRR